MSSSLNQIISRLQFHNLFDSALKEYNQKTGIDIVTDPLIATLLDCDSSDEVLDILQEQAHAFNQYRDGDGAGQLMKQLRPTVDILLGLSSSGVFGKGFGLRYLPAKMIFTGFGLLLAAAKDVSTNYDAIMELFGCFERFLNHLKILTNITSAMGELLAKIMVEMLRVLAEATQQINRGRFTKFTKKLLAENDVQAVLQKLDGLTTEESGMTATQIMEVVWGLFNNMRMVIDDGRASIDNIREALVTMQNISDDPNRMKHDRLREKFQRWLSPPNASVNQNTACRVHHDGTAAWFLEGTFYSEWKMTGSLLWTHGNPGSGKSILCSSIIKDIESLRATGLASIAYYYFDFKDTDKQDCRGLVSSLVTQLCTRRSHQSYDILSSFYEVHENGSRLPSEVELIRCLKNVLEISGQGKVYVIMDAVDECAMNECPNNPGIPSPRENVLRLIKELVDLRHPDLRVCVTSRPEVDIRTVFGPLASHAVSLHDEAGQRGDIINYVKSVVESEANMRRWRGEDKQLVINTLPQNANGIFQLAVCQLGMLRRSFPASIRRVLKELPITLDETYERILFEIDRKERDHVVRLLQCLVVSHRPLRANELAEVLTTQFDEGQIPRLNMDWRPEDPDETVLLACSNLVTTIDAGDHHDDYDHGDTRFIHFSHHSVKRFLTSDHLAGSQEKNLSQYYISPESAHITLAQSCIATLLQLTNHTEDITRGFPLARYAARYWFRHVQYDDMEPHIEHGMEYLFDPDRTHFAAWVSIHDIDRVSSDALRCKPKFPPKPSPLYYATLLGFYRLVEYLVITRRQDPNKSPGGLCTPLHAAAFLGHTTIARFLLEHTADVNARNGYHPTPLHRAVERGNLDVTRLLLDHGADVNVLDDSGVAPLHKAFRYQDLDLAGLLVKGGANVNVRNKSGSTPLHEASRNGNLNAMRFLLIHGAAVDVLNRQCVAPLHEASRSQKLNAVELLVKSGANVNVRNKSMSTPLHNASGRGDLDVVRVLLRLGADVNVRHGQGVTPLHEAILYQKVDVVTLLLKAGADVHIRDKYKSTPLHEVAGIGNLDITKLLLSHGADINVLDHWGNPPLYTALRSRKFSVAEVLVKEGADVNVRDKSKSTPHYTSSASGDGEGASPLHKAIRSGKLDAVERLINDGANVNIRDKSNATPLHEASAVGNLDIVRLLMAHGAEINAFDRRGDSPIHTALRCRKFDVVEHLVKNGADVKAWERSRIPKSVPGEKWTDGSRLTWMVAAVATVAVAVTAVVNRYR